MFFIDSNPAKQRRIPVKGPTDVPDPTVGTGVGAGDVVC